MVIKTLSNHHIKTSVSFLSGLDKDWEGLIKKVGACHLKISSELSPYESLLKTISYQQLHAKAAETIFQRLLSQFNGHFPKAYELLKVDPMFIRSSGFSQTKTETLFRIAEASINKIIPNEQEIIYLSDDEIIKRLSSIKGVGIWTAQMLLIFNLGRLDVLPINDLGIQKGYQALKKLDALPKPKLLLTAGEAWKPYRTIASWYLWHSH
ncbi:MAG: DNA-3-methyladenine glycosylase family protein [Candidatus Methylopumilus sp.]